MKKKSLPLIALLLCLAVALAACAPAATAPGPEAALTPDPVPAQGTPAETPPSPPFDEEYDIVVVGAGAAGLSAAVEAADNGAKRILVLEKLGAIGGTSMVSQGMISGYDTDIQKATGVTVSPDDMYDLLMMNAKYKLDPALARITVDNSKDSVNWLQNTLNVPFSPEAVVGYGPYQMMHIIDGGGNGMRAPFETALAERGITVYTETPGTALLRGADGELAGVLCKKGGADYRIGAKAVVIATGGYACNAELAARLDPTYKNTLTLGHPGCTGDGVVMASNFGAATTNSIMLMAVLKDYEVLANMNGNSAQSGVNPFMGGGGAIFVGADGNRFTDERAGGFMNQDLNQPVLDQMQKDELPYVWIVNDQKGVDEKQAKRGLDLEYLHADTIEELAGLMGVDAAGLFAAVARWNEQCGAGADADFGRTAGLIKLDTPPYYAVSVNPTLFITYGGILRSENAEALRADGTAVAGLYCAGEVSGNSAYMGFTLSNAVTWGRIAGKNAAAFVR